MVRYVPLTSLGRALGFVVKTQLRLQSFSESCHQSAYSFMKCFSVENNPWENENIVVSCPVFVGVVFFISFPFFFFFLLLSSFKTNDKKEFSNKVCVSLGTAFLCQLEAIPHVNSRALRPSQSDLLLGFSLKNLLVKPSLPNHNFQKEVKLKT